GAGTGLTTTPAKDGDKPASPPWGQERSGKKFPGRFVLDRRDRAPAPSQNVGNGAPGTIRTSDPQIRSLMLYPAELRARAGASLRGRLALTQPPSPTFAAALRRRRRAPRPGAMRCLVPLLAVTLLAACTTVTAGPEPSLAPR